MGVEGAAGRRGGDPPAGAARTVQASSRRNSERVAEERVSGRPTPTPRRATGLLGRPAADRGASPERDSEARAVLPQLPPRGDAGVISPEAREVRAVGHEGPHGPHALDRHAERRGDIVVPINHPGGLTTRGGRSKREGLEGLADGPAALQFVLGLCLPGPERPSSPHGERGTGGRRLIDVQLRHPVGPRNLVLVTHDEIAPIC